MVHIAKRKSTKDMHIFCADMFPYADAHSNPLRSIWFPFVVTDLALMQATLCIAAAHYQLVSGKCLGAILDVIRMQAIRLVNHRLKDPIDGISDGTVSAVLGLAESEVSGARANECCSRIDTFV